MLIAVLSVAGIASGVISVTGCFSNDVFGFDLRMRRNEILCAHQGVNSFRIWNRELVLPGFVPLTRPDRADVERKDGDKVVHAYPAWHTLFFYFYGWLPELMCVAMMTLAYVACTWLVVGETLKEARVLCCSVAAGFALSMISFSTIVCFALLNYGMFLTAVFLLLRKFDNAERPVLAGLCWAVMMIKPQVGLLLFWPLLWRGKYKTIVVAFVACTLASCVTAFLVKENPIDLILQIPEIGRPYGGYTFVDKVLKPIFGDSVGMIWMGCFFCLSGLIAYGTRGVRDFLVASAPIVAFIPMWTYSGGYDHVILFGWYLVTVVCALKSKPWRCYWCALILVTVFKCAWSSARECGLFNPAGKGWIYHMVAFGLDMLTVGASVAFSWLAYNRKLPKELLAGVAISPGDFGIIISERKQR